MTDWEIWFSKFLAEYQWQAGYTILPGDFDENELREAYFNHNIAPKQAAQEEIEEEA